MKTAGEIFCKLKSVMWIFVKLFRTRSFVQTWNEHIIRLHNTLRLSHWWLWATQKNKTNWIKWREKNTHIENKYRHTQTHIRCTHSTCSSAFCHSDLMKKKIYRLFWTKTICMLWPLERLNVRATRLLLYVYTSVFFSSFLVTFWCLIWEAFVMSVAEEFR